MINSCADRLLTSDLCRCDAVQLVVFHLFAPSAVGLIYGLLHRFGNRIGVHDDESVDISCGAAGCLRQGSSASQEAFLVSIEDRHQ